MICSSKRLNLRYYRSEDIAPIFESYTGDCGSAKFLARLPHDGIEQTEHMLRQLSTSRSLAANGKCIWIIEAFIERMPVGMLTIVQEGESMVIHFGVGAPFRSRGYAAESLALAAEHLWSVGQKSICSFTDVDNTAAQAALKKAGFVCTGRTDAYYKAPQLGGEYRAVYHFKFKA